MAAPPAALRRLRRMPLLSPRLWLRRLVFWIGAVMVALVAIGFAWAADAASRPVRPCPGAAAVDRLHHLSGRHRRRRSC